MKRIKCLLALIFFIFLNLSAAYLTYEPVTITQPDGTVLECFASGDEFINWTHDENNFTIIKNLDTGYFCYADLVNDRLVPTSLIYGESNPTQAGLEPGVMFIPENIEQKRTARMEHFNERSNRVFTIGEMNNLVLFIRFAEEPEFTGTPSYYDSMLNGVGVNSLYQYYDEVSDEQLEITSQMYPEGTGANVISWQDVYTRNYYQPYDFTTNPYGYQDDDQLAQREHTMLKDALIGVASEIPADLDLDNDDDGYVDNVTFIIKGQPESGSNLLWPHIWNLYSYDVTINGASVQNFSFQMEGNLEDNNTAALCHDMFHIFGAPDMYHYTSNGITPLGVWDLMAENTNPPPHMTTYMKAKYGGWMEEIPELEISGEYSLNPVYEDALSSFCFMSPNSASEMFVVEYRKQEGIFESSLPGSGMIIYRATPSLYGNHDGPLDEVYIYRPDGTTVVDGAITQAFYSLEAGRTAINETTNPTPFLWNGAEGGLDIDNIGSAGEAITFQLHVDMVVDFTSAVTEGPASLGINFINESTPVDQIVTYEWDFDGDGVYDSNEINPFHLYTEEGVYDVTLRITDLETEEIITKPAYINVTNQDAITGNVAGVWSVANSPYTIVDEITVPTGCDLIIEPGTKVQIESNSWIDVLGKIDVSGTFENPVDFFTTSQWHGMKLIDSDLENKLIFAKFHNVIGNALIVDNSTLEVNNCMFMGGSGNINSTVHLRNEANVEISQTLFMNNESGNSGGALSCMESELVLENNLVVNNSGDAAAFKFTSCNPTLLHNTIAGNSAAGTNGFIIDFSNSNAIMHNNIIWGEDEAFDLYNSFPEVSYNCISGGFEGVGNISDDPMFEAPSAEAGAGNGNLIDLWSLQAGSPCIDAGLDEAQYYDVSESGMGTELPDLGAFGSMGFPLEYSVDASEDELVPQLETSMKIYPNPFNPTTNIMLNLSDKDQENPVSLNIFNLKGQLVKTVINNETTDERAYSWNGQDNNGSATASGIYFVQLKTASDVTTSKILLMK